MKQTAVEWLVEELGINHLVISKNMPITNNIFKQAKEMEKQQIIDAGNTCAFKQHIDIEKVNKMSIDEMLEFALEETITFGEEYYDETFNK